MFLIEGLREGIEKQMPLPVFVGKYNILLPWIPDEPESSLRDSFTEQQLAVPTGIPIQLTYELGAPLRERSLCQPVIVRYTSFSCLVVSHGT
jgi:hypothetical protein